MNRITVKASRDYDVIIGTSLLDKIDTFVGSVQANASVAIISDDNVWPLYGGMVADRLSKSGYRVVRYVFHAGEASKNAQTYLDILNFLAESHITRSDLLIALGGGVVGDMTGFAAATYLRGIAYIQIPTTLLAMVESSVGGKTAIDLPAGKNLVGAFYQPALVLCDTSALDTLPRDVFADGCAEVIKYAVLYDPELMSHLMECGPSFDREFVITTCVRLKRNVVVEDEFDTGSRQKLNLGHTLGHGIEAHSNYTISHGKAVAIGMAMITKASEAAGICRPGLYKALCSVLQQFGLPVRADITAEQLFSASLKDKKRSGKVVNLILPVTTGTCVIQPTSRDQLEAFIKAGL